MLTPQPPSLYSYKAAHAYNPELNYVVVRYVWMILLNRAIILKPNSDVT